MTKRVPPMALVALVSAGTAVLGQVAAPTAEVMSAGQTGYERNCQNCHGANGEGGIGVQLQGNPILQSSAGVVEMIITGYANHGMPPFAALPDETIAAIATFLRNSWGASYGLVEPSLVAQIRDQIEAAGPRE